MYYITKSKVDGHTGVFNYLIESVEGLKGVSPGTHCIVGKVKETEVLNAFLQFNLSEIAKMQDDTIRLDNLVRYFTTKKDVLKENGIFEAVHQLEEHIDFLKLRVSGRGA